MLFARIDGFDFHVMKASVTWKQSEVAEFSADILHRDLVETTIDPYLRDFSLYFAGTEIVSGIVMDDPKIAIKNKTAIATLNGYDEVGRLITKMSRFGAHYQEIRLIAIIADLLGSTSDWEIGNISTMSDPNQVTTIDLRSKEVLWSQVAEASKSVDGIFVRYGGINDSNGKFILDVGEFGELSNIAFADSDNIISITLEKSTNRQYRKIRSIGGLAGTTTITLQHASLYDPTLLTDPDFPISSTSNGWIVTNNALTTGFEVAKKFTLNKTRNDAAPTATERNQAGYGLYLKTVRFLKKNNQTSTLRLNAITNEVPQIDNTFFVNASVSEKTFDGLAEVPRAVSTFNVDAFYRATSISLNFDQSARRDTVSEIKTSNLLRWQLELTDGEYAELFDDSTIVYEALEPHDQSDTLTVTTPPSVSTGSQAYGSSDAPNVACLPDVAKVYTIALPSVPPGAVGVQAAYHLDSSAADVVQILQAPALPATGWQGCVQYAGSWPPPAPVTVTLTIYFIFLF